MLTTTRRDQRTRRQSLFTLEALDDRLVLSAAAAGAVGEAVSAKAMAAEARHEARHARIEARHEAHAARVAARHAAHAARVAARHAALTAAHPTPSAILIPLAGAAPTTTSAKTTTSAPAAPTTTTSTPSPVTVVTTNPTGTSDSGSTGSPTSSAPTSSGPLPSNVGAALQSLYSEYQSEGNNFHADESIDQALQISGTSVEVSLKIGSGSDFNAALSQLQSDGLQLSSSSATYGLINGMLPIAQLPAAAQIASSVNPVFAPQLQ